MFKLSSRKSPWLWCTILLSKLLWRLYNSLKKIYLIIFCFVLIQNKNKKMIKVLFFLSCTLIWDQRLRVSHFLFLRRKNFLRFTFILTMERQLMNIFLHGIACMILFTAFQTTSMLSVLYYIGFYLWTVLSLLCFLLAKCIGRNEEWNSKWNWLSR